MLWKKLQLFLIAMSIPLLVGWTVYRGSPAVFTGDVIIDGDLDLTDTATNQLKLPMSNDATTPTLCFDGSGTCDTGFYEISDGIIGVANNGNLQFRYSGSVFRGDNADAGALRNEAATSTNPTFTPEKDDGDTGIGWVKEDTPAIIGGSIPLMVFGTTVTLTSAQMLALAGVPVTVVAAQGAGTIIEFVKALIIYDDATDYAAGTEEEMVIEYEDGDDASKEGEADGFIDGNADAAILLEPVDQANPATEDFVDNVNDALRILNTGGTREIENNATVCETDSGDLRVVTVAAHGLGVSQGVVFGDGTGSVCTGITAATTYFVQQVDDANKFNIAATQGGAAITYTDTGTAFDSDAWEDWDSGTGTLTIKITYRVHATGL